MKVSIQNKLEEKQDVLIRGLFKEDTDLYGSYNPELQRELKEALAEKRFDAGKYGETFSCRLSSLPFKKILLIGLGPQKEFSLEKLRRAIGKTLKMVRSQKFTSCTMDLAEVCKGTLPEQELGRTTAEGFFLSLYVFDKYLSDERKKKLGKIESVSVQWTGGKGFTNGFSEGEIIAKATNFAKDLVNESAGVATPAYLEKQAKTIAKSAGFAVRVVEKKEMEEKGLNLLLGVNAGSSQAPKLLFLEYKGASGKPLAIVGKGITFDSGGYNLKPTKYIEDMKSDMAGAAAVLATLKAAAELKVKKNLLGVMPLCENMVSGSAQHPGDIVVGFNGKSVEIGNTDAEGRLILADAMAYTEDQYQPEVMIDLATLTGACVVAFGYYAAGLITEDMELRGQLEKAGEESGDRVWALPFYEDYQDWMDGSISDLNNISTKGKGYEAGSITAGVFLRKFVDKARWVHLDIAGSAYWTIENDYTQKGATGSGVRLLMYWLLRN